MKTLEEKINFLIESDLGESSRLNELLARIKSGKQIYNSDLNYVEQLFPTSKVNSEIDKSSTKLEISNNPSKTKSKKKVPSPLRNIRDIGRPYGISYNVYQRDEVKIHKGSCHHVQGASQQGSVKWMSTKSLKEAILVTRQLYPKYGDWKCPRCCLYNGASYFECRNCKRYSEGYDNTEKLHSKSWRIAPIILLIIPILIIFTGIQPRLNGLSILLILIGIIILIIENRLAPLVCCNCLSKDWDNHFIYK